MLARYDYAVVMCLSVRHTPLCVETTEQNWTGFWHRGWRLFFHRYPTIRKFGYLHKWRYFPLELCPKLRVSRFTFATVMPRLWWHTAAALRSIQATPHPHDVDSMSIRRIFFAINARDVDTTKVFPTCEKFRRVDVVWLELSEGWLLCMCHHNRRIGIVSGGARAVQGGPGATSSSQERAPHPARHSVVRDRERVDVRRAVVRQHPGDGPLLPAARQVRAHHRQLREELRAVQLPPAHHQPLRVRRRVRIVPLRSGC